MSLDFLGVSGSGVDGALARSPMEPCARAAGARIAPRDGWDVAVAFASDASETVCWIDTSHLPKLELQGSSEAIDAAARTRLSCGTAVRCDDAWWCRLTRTRALVIGARPGVSVATSAWAPISGTAGKSPGGDRDDDAGRDAGGVDVVDVTSSFAALTLVGPLARETIARFCALDLRPAVAPVGALRPGSIARQPGIVIREAPERYLLLFGWATGEYMWSVVADAGAHLGGRPAGVDALAALPEPAAAHA